MQILLIDCLLLVFDAGQRLVRLPFRLDKGAAVAMNLEMEGGVEEGHGIIVALRRRLIGWASRTSDGSIDFIRSTVLPLFVLLLTVKIVIHGT